MHFQLNLSHIFILLGTILATVTTLPIPNHRVKRQIFREDIPHHRPLTGATYHLHAGYPHPGRFNENDPLVVPPNPHHPSPPPPELTQNDLNDIDPPNIHDNQHNPHHNDENSHGHYELVSNEVDDGSVNTNTVLVNTHSPVSVPMHAHAQAAVQPQTSLGNLFPNLNAIWEIDNNEISGQVPTSGSYSWNIRS